MGTVGQSGWTGMGAVVDDGAGTVDDFLVTPNPATISFLYRQRRQWDFVHRISILKSRQTFH